MSFLFFRLFGLLNLFIFIALLIQIFYYLVQNVINVFMLSLIIEGFSLPDNIGAL